MTNDWKGQLEHTMTLKADQHCQSEVWERGPWPRSHACRARWSVEWNGKKFCKIHDPKKADARSEARSRKWDAEMAVKNAHRDVTLAAERVYKSRIGAGWEMEQQRQAVDKLVAAYGTLEAARAEFAKLKA